MRLSVEVIARVFFCRAGKRIGVKGVKRVEMGVVVWVGGEGKKERKCLENRKENQKLISQERCRRLHE